MVEGGGQYLDVSHAVVVEVGRGGEPFPADGALVRLLPAVDAPVGVERAGRRESLAAHVADVRFLPCNQCNPSMLVFVFMLIQMWI